MNKAQFINQSSLNTEYYTPGIFIEAARQLMGSIDYDPASSEQANKIVKAVRFATAPGWIDVKEQADGLPTRCYKDGGGLDEVWQGNVWMNHPFGSRENACRPDCKKTTCQKRGFHLGNDYEGNEAWIHKLIGQYKDYLVKKAVMICFASTSESWFTPLLDYPLCWVTGRVNYLDPVSLLPIKGATKGSVIVSFGNSTADFKRCFSKFGKVHAPVW